jgi:hypothetical protein
MRQKCRQPIGKSDVVADDHRDGRPQDLGPIPFKSEFGEFRLALRTANPDEPRPCRGKRDPGALRAPEVGADLGQLQPGPSVQPWQVRADRKI